MASHLCKPFEAHVFDLNADAMQPLVEAGATAARSCREIAEHAEVIGVCVLDDAGTRAVVAGEDGLLTGARPGAIIMLHSTIHPDTARDLAGLAGEQGVHIVDAQMTGGPGGAAAGTLRYMVGGEDEVVARCRSVLEHSASEITHCGPVGAGSIAKLCNNLVQFVCWQGYVEAFRLAEHAGLSNEKLTEVLSWIMNDNARTFINMRQVREQDPGNEGLNNAFDAAMNIAEKDLTLALEVGRSVGISMPTTGLASQQVGRLFANPELGRR
jgi:3-hydroxyisobutyrate dehydrogenase-like beta-hydroxyacid dehydrogenase